MPKIEPSILTIHSAKFSEIVDGKNPCVIIVEAGTDESDFNTGRYIVCEILTTKLTRYR